MDIPLPAGAALLPPLYANWIRELLSTPIPEEPEATCLDCAMCGTNSSRVFTPSDIQFNTKTKCCTFFPEIPNFLAGRILLNNDPAAAGGRALFENRCKQDAILRPQGVFPSLEIQARYLPLSEGFGTDLSLRCGYYLEAEGGLCGIWENRNSRCSTFFCKHVRGRTGRDFWRTLKELLAAVEESLVLWCIHRLKAGNDSFRVLFSFPENPGLEEFQKRHSFYQRSGIPREMRSQEQEEQLQQEMWGSWQGREFEFFVECAGLIREMTWEEVTTISGEPVNRHSHRLRQAFADLLSEEVPEKLLAGRFRSFQLNESTTRVWGYSNYDPIDIPRAVVDVLHRFDGRPCETVLAEIHAEEGLTIPNEVLRKLYDFRILSDEINP